MALNPIAATAGWRMTSALNLPASYPATARELVAPGEHLSATSLTSRRNAFAAEVADQLDRFAQATNDNRYARAARLIRGQPGRGGRKPIDDSVALGELARELESGRSTSVEAAADMIAATLLAGRWSHESAKKRLAKKYRGTKLR
jgi:hypothetical protein